MRILAAVVSTCLIVAFAAAPVQAQEQPPETYVVKQGDTLYSIARRFGMSVAQLQRLNDLSDNTIRIGQELRVRSSAPPPDTAGTADTVDTAAADAPPADSAAPDERASVDAARADGAAAPLLSDTDTVVPASEALIEAPINRLVHGAYVIRPGDTFFSVAARYGTTADSLFALNGAHTNPLPPGKVLRLPGRFALPAHVVQASDSTIYTIAARYGVSARALRHANDLEEADLDAGQRLRIPGRRAPEPASRGTLPAPDAQGPVTMFPETYAGRLTASGTRYDPERLVVSHPELPFGSTVLLTNPETQRSTFAHVIDRGPVEEALLLDVSAAVAERLGLAPGSEQPVALRIVR